MVLCILAGNFDPLIYAPWNLENIRKSTNNLSFLCPFFINEITVSDAGPDIIRSHLFHFSIIIMLIFRKVVTIISELDPGRILALQKDLLESNIFRSFYC